MDTITRLDAQAAGQKRFFTGKACVKGHVCERLVSNRGCLECMYARHREWSKKNTKHMTEYSKKWCRANPEKASAQKRKYYKKHRAILLEKVKARTLRKKDAIRAYKTEYYDRNAETIRKKSREHYSLRRDYYKAYARRREIAQLRAVPPWADLKEITSIYGEANRKTAETGIDHHVDHIIPLKHPLVCGLHVHNNLRVLPARENRSKSNHFTVEGTCHA